MPEEYRIKFSDFIKHLEKDLICNSPEMEGKNWQDKPLVFNTENRLGLHYLSIYERDGAINIDIGTCDDDICVWCSDIVKK